MLKALLVLLAVGTRCCDCLSSSSPEVERKVRPLVAGTPLERMPAKELCSRCGLCETSQIAKVAEACAFIGEGWSRIPSLEESIHGRSRRYDDENELYFGVTEALAFAKQKPRIENSAWTGIVSGIAAEALRQNVVDAVVGVGRQGDGPLERMTPRPVVCRTPDEVLAQIPGVKPVLSNTLSVFDGIQINAKRDRRVLFLGVGCQVRALRALDIKKDLGLEELFVLGTCCADNVRSPEALQRFLSAVSESPDTAVGFEFMQNYNVEVKHISSLYESVPVFTLPSDELKDIIAPSCYSCHDYVNSLADLVVGYMGTPAENVPMTEHTQFYITRNEKGSRLLSLISDRLLKSPPLSEPGPFGGRTGFATQVTEQDLDGIFLKNSPKDRSTASIFALPAWFARLAAKLLTAAGPVGLEFAKNSIDYHQLRNTIYPLVSAKNEATRNRRAQIIPSHTKRIEEDFYPGFADRLLEKYHQSKSSSS